MTHISHRVRQAGVYFVTSRTWNSRALFAKPEVAQILLDQLLDCRQRGFYKLHPFVIMPDHFHALLTPSDTTSLEKAVQMIKGGSSHQIKQHLNYASAVWQEGFHDRWIRDESEFQERVAYIRSNPVSAKLAAVPEEYVFGSAFGRHLLDLSKYEESTSGAKAPSSIHNDYVAVKTATYKDSAAKTNPTHKP
jgi:putative transposase